MFIAQSTVTMKRYLKKIFRTIGGPKIRVFYLKYGSI